MQIGIYPVIGQIMNEYEDGRIDVSVNDIPPLVIGEQYNILLDDGTEYVMRYLKTVNGNVLTFDLPDYLKPEVALTTLEVEEMLADHEMRICLMELGIDPMDF